MQLLLIHSKGFDWEANDKAVANAEPLTADLKEYHTDESVLVVFIAVETIDTRNSGSVIANASLEIQQALTDIGETRAILYPWVHLAKSPPASPSDAMSILKRLNTHLQEENPGLQLIRAPFGYYKRFNIHCIGHPLAERSKSILGEEALVSKPASAEVVKALKAEEEVRSTFFVLTPRGDMTPFDEYSFGDQRELQIFVSYETAKDRTFSEPPAHVEIMKNLELVDYEYGSDAGNFRILPRGFIVKQLIESHVIEMAAQYGALIVETPLMYSYEHPSLKKYLERFPARQYVVKSGKHDYFLRFSACFGQFLALSDATISYRQLPVKIFELAKSFRREQRGELAGIRRLRAFTMPDLHTAAIDMDMARREFEAQFRLAARYMHDLEIRFETAFRMTTPFFEEHKAWIISLIKELDHPILLELFDHRYAYFILKFEFNVVDSQKKAAALSTVQIDVENAERFAITYVNEQGEKQHPYLLHCSLSGSTERVIYGLLEDQIKKMGEGAKPQLPLWLTPVQVRIIPVTPELLPYAEKVSNQFEQAQIRVEIDDRDMSLGKRIRAAEKLWTPIIVVVGKKEQERNDVNTRYRIRNTQEQQSPRDVINHVNQHTRNKPHFPRTIPKYVSKQPKFTRIV